MGQKVGTTRRSARLWQVLPVALLLVFVGFMVVRSVAKAHTPTPHSPSNPSTSVKRQQNSQKRARPTNSGPQPLAVSGSWKLLLNARFAASKLDTAIWRPGWFGSGVTGPINAHEAACYSPANVGVSPRTGLLLRVDHARSRCGNRLLPYTGAVLSTNPHDGRSSGGFTYRYGVLEAKIYIPATTGSRIADWPAVVTLGQVWPRDGEDDVVENLGGVVCSHFHSPGYAPGGTLGGCDPNFTPGWHVVSSNWEPGSVTWYYDGIEIAHANKGITSSPMYIVLVNTVSAKSLALARPDAVRVAYVRVWQRLRPAGRSR